MASWVFTHLTVFAALLFQLCEAQAARWTIPAPPEEDHQSRDGRKVVCYYTPTSYFRPGQVPANVCTHLIYAFGSISGAGPNITTPTSGQKSAWATLTSLRGKNPGLKVLLSLQQGFPDVVGSDVKMKQFAYNSVAYLRRYSFDGVDMDWEYPASTQKQAFAQFFQFMKAAIADEAKRTGKRPLLLSIALPNNQWVAARSFDLKSIGKQVDFATAMAYDFHLYTKSDTTTGYNSPLYTPPGESKYLSASAMMGYYLRDGGVPASKLLLGIPTYGRSWQLASSSSHGLHSQAVGKGSPGPYRHLTGIYTFPDVCLALKQGATSVRDSNLTAVYLCSGNTWVAYDDVTTVKEKCSWVIKNGLGGVGVWALHIDDIDNECELGRLPLVNTMKKMMTSATSAP